MTGELSPASVYVSLLPVVEACVVVAVTVPGRVVKSSVQTPDLEGGYRPLSETSCEKASNFGSIKTHS